MFPVSLVILLYVLVNVKMQQLYVDFYCILYEYKILYLMLSNVKNIVDRKAW